MSELRWEWTLPSGAVVAATLEPTTGVESVYVAGELVSRSDRGAMSEGHPVTERDDATGERVAVGVVAFDPKLAICVHRSVEGFEVRPFKWPAPKSRTRPPPPGRPLPTGLLLLLTGAAIVLLAGAMIGRKLLAGRAADADAVVTYRAKNGRFVLRHRAGLSTKEAVGPAAMSGLVLEDTSTGDTLVVAAAPIAPDAARDAWGTQRRMFPEVLVNLPRHDAAYEELSREERTCYGQPGAFVRARVHGRGGEARDVHGCVFSRGGSAYAVATMVREGAKDAEVARVEAALASLELTALEAM